MFFFFLHGKDCCKQLLLIYPFYDFCCLAYICVFVGMCVAGIHTYICFVTYVYFLCVHIYLDIYMEKERELWETG